MRHRARRCDRRCLAGGSAIKCMEAIHSIFPIEPGSKDPEVSESPKEIALHRAGAQFDVILMTRSLSVLILNGLAMKSTAPLLSASFAVSTVAKPVIMMTFVDGECC
jgi:hypothetical protein